MRLLTLVADAAQPPDALEAAAGVRSCAGTRPQTLPLRDLWPPAAIAERMAARELELLQALDGVRGSIHRLRAERAVLFGQLRDLCQPTGCPLDLSGADEVPDGGVVALGPEALALVPWDDPAPLVDVETDDEGLGAVGPQTLTPEEEFEALVRRLRELGSDTPPAHHVVVRSAESQPPRVARRLTAVAATAVVVVLGVPTVGHVGKGADQSGSTGTQTVRPVEAAPHPDPHGSVDPAGPVATNQVLTPEHSPE